MGVLGWTEQETLSASIPAIELAFKGAVRRIEMFHGIGFGGAEKPAEPPPMPAESVFAAMRVIAPRSRDGA